jgi:two-component system chemotaxis response regulator CheB
MYGDEWSHKMTSGFSRPIRVLAADDSAVMRGVLKALFPIRREKPLRNLPSMELCGLVTDGVECLSAVNLLRPDVVVLDLEMPRMHGLDVLERLRVEEPGLPVIMCSSYTERGARTTLEALALGAADYVMKPAEQSSYSAALELLSAELLPRIAALAKLRREAGLRWTGNYGREAGEREVARGPGSGGEPMGVDRETVIEIVMIAVSTGGPSALESMLPKLPENFPVPIMIAQHMPKLFTGALAERLDRACGLRVREAFEGAEVAAGTVWLAPGDAHMEVREASTSQLGRGNAVVRLHQQQSLNHCKPSADYLFSSAARIYGAGTLALVMTGMGSDGLSGARMVHKMGGLVLAQDEETSAVWGMPGRVYQAGIASRPIPLPALATELIRRVNQGRGGSATGYVVLPRKPRAEADAILEEVHGLL